MKKQYSLSWAMILLFGALSLCVISFSYATETKMEAAAPLPFVPIMKLDREVHFLTPEGEDVPLPAGTYHINVSDPWLMLLPEGEVRSAMVLIEATQGNHEEHLTEAMVRAGPNDNDPGLFHLAVLLPDGTGWETIGSYSGIRPRSSTLAFLQRPGLKSTKQPAPKALQLSEQDHVVTQEIIRLQGLMKQGPQAVPDKQTVISAQSQQRDQALLQDLLELRTLLGK